MKLICRQILSTFLSITLASSGAVASAAVSASKTFPVVDTNVFKGSPYLKNCGGALAAIKEGRLDAFLMEQANTPAERAQLLQDYELIFSKEFYLGTILALKEERIEYSPGAIKDYIKQLTVLIAQPDDKFIEFTRLVLRKIADVIPGNPDNALTRVRVMRSKNILAALEASPERLEFEKVISEAVKFSLVETMKHGLLRKIDLAANNMATDYAFFGTGAMVLLTAMYFWGYAPGYHTYNGWGEKISSQDFNLFFFENALSLLGSGLVGLIGGVASTFGVQGIQNIVQSLRKSRSPAPKSFSTGKEEVTGNLLALAEQYQKEADEVATEKNRTPEDADTKANDTAKPDGENSSAQKLAPPNTHGVHSIEHACNHDICDLNPVELAYLGHLDVIEIHQLTANTTHDVSASNMTRLIDALRDRAREVQAEPDSYRSQVRLTAAVNDLKLLLLDSPESKHAAVEALVLKMQKISELYENLRRMPFSARSVDLHEERLLKSEILLGKLNSDLQTLGQMRFDQERFEAYLQRIKPTLEELDGHLQVFPTTGEGWKSLADEISLLVDRLKANLRG